MGCEGCGSRARACEDSDHGGICNHRCERPTGQAYSFFSDGFPLAECPVHQRSEPPETQAAAAADGGADEAHAALADAILGCLRSERAGTHGLDSAGPRYGMMRPLNLVVGSALCGSTAVHSACAQPRRPSRHSVQFFLFFFWTFPRSPAALRQLFARSPATGSDLFLFLWGPQFCGDSQGHPSAVRRPSGRVRNWRTSSRIP